MTLEDFAVRVDAVPVDGTITITTHDFAVLSSDPRWTNFFDRQREGNQGFVGVVFARRLVVE